MLLDLRSLWEAQSGVVAPTGSNQGGGLPRFGKIRIQPPPPIERPKRLPPVEPKVEPSIAAIDEAEILALYAAGVIDIEELAALLAA